MKPCSTAALKSSGFANIIARCGRGPNRLNDLRTLLAGYQQGRVPEEESLK